MGSQIQYRGTFHLAKMSGFKFQKKWETVELTEYGHHGDMLKCLYYLGVHIKWAVRKIVLDLRFINTKTETGIFIVTKRRFNSKSKRSRM